MFMSSESAIATQVDELIKEPWVANVDLPALPNRQLDPSRVASVIDHTLLAPAATNEQVIKVCEDAAKLHTATVCVNSSMVALAASTLAGLGSGSVKAISVVAFPFGSTNTQAKVAETKQAIADGAAEIDMVQNQGMVKNGQWSQLFDDVRAVVEAAAPVPVKVILETAALTHQEIAASALVSTLAGAAFLKTSTGYGPGGAKPEAVRLLREVADRFGKGNTQVKASGGIRSWETCQLMVAQGADRIGASGTQAIVDAAAGAVVGAPAEAGTY